MKKKTCLFTILAFVIAAVTCTEVLSCDDDDDFLNDFMLTNSTEYNWHDADIHFMNDNNKVKKIKAIGTLERYNFTYVPKEADYFFVEFKDDNGIVRQTEKYLTAATVNVKTVVK